MRQAAQKKWINNERPITYFPKDNASLRVTGAKLHFIFKD